MTTIRNLIVKGLSLLIKQGAWAVTANGRCTYENSQGHRCIVGLLAPELVDKDPPVGYITSLQSHDRTGERLARGLGVTITSELLNQLSVLQNYHDRLSMKADVPTLKLFQMWAGQDAPLWLREILLSITPEELA